MEIPEKVIKHANQHGIRNTDRDRYLKSWRFPNSYAAAVKAHCIECCGFEDTVTRIKECSVIVCALHKLRPFRDNSTDDEEQAVEELEGPKKASTETEIENTSPI